jgi:hypothetical protein
MIKNQGLSMNQNPPAIPAQPCLPHIPVGQVSPGVSEDLHFGIFVRPFRPDRSLLRVFAVPRISQLYSFKWLWERGKRSCAVFIGFTAGAGEPPLETTILEISMCCVNTYDPLLNIHTPCCVEGRDPTILLIRSTVC